MIRFSFVLTVIAFISMSACIAFTDDKAAEGGTIRGKITDTTPEQNPIEGVEVKIFTTDSKKKFTVKTDANGNYKCANLPAGIYNVYSKKEGYGDRFRISAVVVNGKNEIVDLKMFNFMNHARQRVKHRIMPLFHYVTENMVKHHDLDETVADALLQSIRKTFETAIKRHRTLSTYLVDVNDRNLDVLEGLLLHFDIKVIFTEHLTETQLQDYTDFINTRRHREKQAIAYQLTALFDQELCLTAEQRKYVVQLLHDKTDGLKLTSSNMLTLDSLKAADLVRHRSEISLNGILTKTQRKIWQALVNVDDDEKESRKIFFARTEANIKKAVDDGRMTEEEAAAKLDELQKKLGIGPKDEKLESQERMKQFLEAKLTAHTEMLGKLNERASQRLTLAVKGVVQQYLETKERMAMYREAEAKIMGALAARELTPEQADKKLGDLTEKLWGENIEYEETGEPYAVDITNHPLYQEAIKDILSEDAYAQYTSRQAERDNFRQQASRDLAVALMDIRLLLNDAQRKQLETTAAQLTLPPLEGDAPMNMFYQLFQQVNHDMLSPWQRNELEIQHGAAE